MDSHTEQPSSSTDITEPLMTLKFSLDVLCLIAISRHSNDISLHIMMFIPLSSVIGGALSKFLNVTTFSIVFLVPLLLTMFVVCKWLDQILSLCGTHLAERKGEKTDEERVESQLEEKDEEETEIQSDNEEKEGEGKEDKELAPILAIPDGLNSNFSLALQRIYGFIKETPDVEVILKSLRDTLDKRTHIGSYFRCPGLFPKVMRKAMNDIIRGNTFAISSIVMKKCSIQIEISKLEECSHVDIRSIIDVVLHISEFLRDCHEYVQAESSESKEKSLDISDYVEVDDPKEADDVLPSGKLQSSSKTPLPATSENDSKDEKRTLLLMPSLYQCIRAEFSKDIGVKLPLTGRGKRELRIEIDNALSSRSMTFLLSCILCFEVLGGEK